MKRFLLAIVSPSNPSEVVGTFEAYGKDKADALKNARRNPDMQDAHFYPVEKPEVKEEEPVETEAAA